MLAAVALWFTVVLLSVRLQVTARTVSAPPCVGSVPGASSKVIEAERRLIDGRRRGAGQHQRAVGIALEREPIEVGDVHDVAALEAAHRHRGARDRIGVFTVRALSRKVGPVWPAAKVTVTPALTLSVCTVSRAVVALATEFASSTTVQVTLRAVWGRVAAHASDRNPRPR